MTASTGRLTATVTGLYRYPVKGLTPERLESVAIAAGRGIPLDRIYALARPDGRYRPEVPEALPKAEYFMLAKNERLAGVQARLDDDARTLTVEVGDHRVLRADLGTDPGRAQAAEFFGRMLDCDPDSPPVIARQRGRRFTDAAPAGDLGMHAISAISLASLRDVEERIGAALDPLRFRANLYWDGMPAFAEKDLVGQVVVVGGMRFAVIAETPRCAATEVDPATGRRDVKVPRLMQQHYGHSTLGVYLQALDDGILSAGDGVEVLPS